MTFCAFSVLRQDSSSAEDAVVDLHPPPDPHPHPVHRGWPMGERLQTAPSPGLDGEPPAPLRFREVDTEPRGSPPDGGHAPCISSPYADANREPLAYYGPSAASYGGAPVGAAPPPPPPFWSELPLALRCPPALAYDHGGPRWMEPRGFVSSRWVQRARLGACNYWSSAATFDPIRPSFWGGGAGTFSQRFLEK